MFAYWFAKNFEGFMTFFEVAAGSRLAMTSTRNTDSGDAWSFKKKKKRIKNEAQIIAAFD